MPLQPRPHTLRWLEQELPAWEREGLLSPESAAALRTRYQSERGQSHQLGLVLISAFGACLVGAGVISLFAYNWDELGRPARTVLALLPLLITQVLAFLTLARWRDSAAVRESVCGGLILSIGAAIALIAQTYQIGGDFAQFMLTWFALSLPAVYLLRSGLGYWLCQIALIVWGSYAQWRATDMLQWYPLFFAATVPYYIWLRNRSDHAIQALFNKWALALALPIGLFLWLDTIPKNAWPFIFTAYFAAGLLLDQSRESLRGRPFALIGALCLSCLLLSLSLHDGWVEDAAFGHDWALLASIATGLVWLAAILITIVQRRYWLLSLALTPLVVLFTQLACIGYGSPDNPAISIRLLPSAILTLYTLAACIVMLVTGMRTRRLQVLNLGLLLLGALAVFKFFDSDLGLALKGAAFITVGGLFLITNFVTVRRTRKGGRHA